MSQILSVDAKLMDGSLAQLVPADERNVDEVVYLVWLVRWTESCLTGGLYS